MLNSETKRHIDAARDVLVGVAPNPTTQIDQITYALIYKFMDDMDQASIKAGGEPSFFTGELEQYAWSKLVDSRMGNQEKMNLYGEALTKFSEANQLPELFRTIFRAAFLPYRSPETLGLFLKEISYFDYKHPEELGNAYEYLLSIMSSQGDAGQFRTPRHIIDFIVDVINPTKDDKVLDPACGTAGFLVSTYNHILEQHDGKDDPEKSEKSLTPDERKKLMQNLQGYDIDPTMVRIAQVNMYLHQFKNPQIFQYDSLTSEERWAEKFDVILANPPFMSPKGGIKPHSKFGISSNRSEVLFVDYIINHLRPKGRAGIIVPEGIIFQTGKAYKELRQNLLSNGLYAVISLPSGVFQPYSGVKTSILLLDNELAKQKHEIAFVKISADGFDLGASKREISRNDLPNAIKFLRKWSVSDSAESDIVNLVSKSVISENQDINLSGDRYQTGTLQNFSNWTRAPLKEAITLNFGERITKKNESGDKYPVYGGGGESFRTDRFNRADELVIARFAMGPNCVRRVDNQFWLMDSGATYSINETFEGKLSKKFVDQLLLNMQDDIFKCARGGAQKNLHLEMFYELEIPIPPIDVQEEIVTELMNYDAIISGATLVIDNWKPNFDIDPNWEWAELGELAEFEYGLGEPALETGEYRYIRITDINDSGLLRSEEPKFINLKKDELNYVLNEGDVLVARTGATYGKCLYFEGNQPAAFAGYLIRVNLNERVGNRFFWMFAQGLEFDKQKKRLVSGGGQPQFNANALAKVKVPIPPIEVQDFLIKSVEAEMKQIDSNRKLIESYNQRKANVISKLYGL